MTQETGRSNMTIAMTFPKLNLEQVSAAVRIRAALKLKYISGVDHLCSVLRVKAINSRPGMAHTPDLCVNICLHWMCLAHGAEDIGEVPDIHKVLNKCCLNGAGLSPLPGTLT